MKQQLPSNTGICTWRMNNVRYMNNVRNIIQFSDSKATSSKPPHPGIDRSQLMFQLAHPATCSHIILVILDTQRMRKRQHDHYAEL